MTSAVTMTMQSRIKESKSLRICAVCSHVEGACACKTPVWVDQRRGWGKGIQDLRNLQFKRILRAFPQSQFEEVKGGRRDR